MKPNTKRLLAVLVALLMILQMTPFTALTEADTEIKPEEDIVTPAETSSSEEFEFPESTDSEETDSENEELMNEESVDVSPGENPDITSAESDDELSADEPDPQESPIESPVDSPDDQEPGEPDSPENEDPAHDEPPAEETAVPYEEYEDGTTSYPEGTVVILEDPEFFDPWPEDMPLELTVSAIYDGSWIKYAIYNFNHTYVLTGSPTKVYDDTALEEDHLIFTIADEGTPLLATEHYQRWNTTGVTIWFVAPDGNVMNGYVSERDLVNAFYTDEEAEAWANEEGCDSCLLDFEEDFLLAFVINGWYPATIEVPIVDQPAVEQTLPEQLESPDELPVDLSLDENLPEIEPDDYPEDIGSDSEAVESAEQHDEDQEQDLHPDEPEEPAETPPLPDNADILPTGVELQTEDGSTDESDSPVDLTDEADPAGQEAEIIPEIEKLPQPDESTVSVGDYVIVNTDTRVYLNADETATDDYDGDFFQGYFVNEAVVQVEDILLDDADREW